MKNEEFIEGIHFYFDANSLMVLTEKYHLERGFCCGNGCRHCPFDDSNVKDLKKTLLAKRKTANKQ